VILQQQVTYLQCAMKPKHNCPEIFKFYQLYFKILWKLGILPFKFHPEQIQLLAPQLKDFPKTLFRINWFYVNLMLAKNSILVLVELIPRDGINDETFGRDAGLIFKLVWFLSILMYWAMFSILRRNKADWIDTISMWIRMEKFMSGNIGYFYEFRFEKACTCGINQNFEPLYRTELGFEDDAETCRRKAIRCILIVKIYGVFITFGVIIVGLMFVWIPRFPLFLYSIVPISWDTCHATLILKMAAGLFELYLGAIAGGCCSLFVFIFGYVSISISNAVLKLRKLSDLKLQRSKCRWDLDSSHILVYKALQVLAGRFNHTFNQLAFVLETVFFCGTSILIYAVICIQSSVLLWMIFLYLALVVLGMDIALFLPVASFNSRSSKLLIHFKGITRGILRRQVNGCSRLKLTPLELHSISRKTVLEYIYLLTNYIVFLVYK